MIKIKEKIIGKGRPCICVPVLEREKQEIIDDPISYLISAKHYASQMEHHQMSVEYDLFDNNGNKLLHLGKYEKDDFINQLYDVVTALIQYHITKKKGQA